MDETFVLFDMVPTSTMEATGSQNVDIRSSHGNQKLGCTVTLVVTTDGRKGQAEITFRALAPDGDVIQQLRADAPDNVRVSINMDLEYQSAWLLYGSISLLGLIVKSQHLG